MNDSQKRPDWDVPLQLDRSRDRERFGEGTSRLEATTHRFDAKMS